MNTIHPSFYQLLSLYFPPELLTFFELKEMRETRHLKTGDVTLHLTLEEKNLVPPLPPEHQRKTVTSKGFHRPITLQHFPIQDKLCQLTIHRRRWEIDGGDTLERSLDFLPLKGLKITTTFGDFLKEADRAGASGGGTDRKTLPGGATR
ncbi:MAG: hypothetical protein AAB853_00085 [Patescibacteria group bacterium]